jgi:hypothetical protein
MVESVFRKSCFFGFFVLMLLAIFCVFFIYALISVHFFNGDLFKPSLTKAESVIFIGFFGFLTLLIIRLLIVDPMNITINSNNQEIVFIHIFFKQKKMYSFSDFDYCVETYERSIGGSAKAIYLIKNKKLKKAIRGYYYLNIDEMQKALHNMPSLGFKKFNLFKSLSLYFTRNP